MPEVKSHPPGTFSWIELSSSDRIAAVDFYTKLFGWTPVDNDMGPDGIYTIVQLKGKDVGGIAQRRDDNIPSNWASYIAVANADETTKKAESLGATIITPPFDVMDLGRMAVLADTQGAVFCLWQPKKHTGIGIDGEAGTLCWDELTVPDNKPALKFYPQLFGWTPKETPEYVQWNLGDQGVGGMFVMEGVPPFWMPYFAVDDADASAAQVTSLGGRLFKDPTDIPNVGRFAIGSDPTGAVFAIIKLDLSSHH